MKTPSFRQRNAWLHTWAGLLLGWLLYAVFLTGSLSYFHEEISLWMTPEQHGSHPEADAPLKALASLQRLAPEASQWTINLPSSRSSSLSVQWLNPGQAPGKGAGQSTTLDANSGEALSLRDTKGGNFLYRFHFELTGMPRIWGRWIVGFAAMCMLIALISGIIIHKKIFKEFFTFRPAKEQRSWLDAHCATSVLALPFHLMITYSGLVLLMLILMPWGVQSAYQGNTQQYFAESGLRSGGPGRGGREGEGKAPAPQAAPLVDIAPLLAQAEQRWTRGIGSIQISQPGTEKAVIELREHRGDSLIDRAATERLRFNGVTGEPLKSPPEAEINGSAATYNVLSSLHMLRFAGQEVRWIFFFSGLLGTAMVATGLIFWSAKRLERDPRHFGHRLVEVLNVGSIVGLPIAIAVYFWANRLLPVGLEGRADLEVQYFLMAWGLCLLHPWVRRYKQAWIEQLAVAALLFLCLPLFNFSLPNSHLLSTLLHGQWLLASTDLSLIAFGALFGLAAWKLAKRRPATLPNAQPSNTQPPEATL